MLLKMISTLEAWEQFAGFYTYRGKSPPARPKDGIWIAHQGGDKDGQLIAGVCLFPIEDAPYVYVEHLAARPGAPPRLVYEAFQIGIAHLRAYGTMTGRLIIMGVDVAGVGKIAERFGFKPLPAVMYLLWPSGQTVGHFDPKVRVDPPEPRTGGDAQAPEVDQEEASPPVGAVVKRRGRVGS